ncbi:MAG: hypothetical protein H6744_01440 [Deltaproteobacteria bacterium]|nr:hypothetical protein [Deltaproteobacteria bacterium]
MAAQRELRAWLGSGPAHHTFLAASGDLVLRLVPTAPTVDEAAEQAAERLHATLSSGGPAIPGPRYPPEEEGELALVVRDPVGRRLRDARGPLPQPVARQLAASVLDAVAGLHAQGSFHGALSPERLLLGRDGCDLRVAEAGLAAFAEDALGQPLRTLTPGVSEFWTSPALMPPELVRGLPLSASSDVFLVAALTWRWLTSRDAYRAPQSLAVLSRLGRGERPSMVTLDLGLPLALAQALDAALSPDPAARPRPDELRALLAPEEAAPIDAAFEPSAGPWSATCTARAPEDAPGAPGTAWETARQARLNRAALVLQVGAAPRRPPSSGRRFLMAAAATLLGVALVGLAMLLSR